MKRVRQQQRRVVRPAGQVRGEVARDGAAMLEDDDVSNAVDEREERRDRRPRRHVDRRVQRSATHIGDRRQRHHGVAQPVGRDNEQPLHTAGQRTVRLFMLRGLQRTIVQ